MFQPLSHPHVLGDNMPRAACGTPLDHFDGVSGKLFLRDRDVRTKQVSYDADLAVRLWNISEALYL